MFSIIRNLLPIAPQPTRGRFAAVGDNRPHWHDRAVTVLDPTVNLQVAVSHGHVAKHGHADLAAFQGNSEFGTVE